MIRGDHVAVVAVPVPAPVAGSSIAGETTVVVAAAVAA